jgi:hypothetical protein
MPRTRTRVDTLYQFDELSPKAQANAIDWYRELWMSSGDTDWADYTLEDADEIAKLLGIEIKRRDVRLMNGKTRQDPGVYFQLHTQGSGASFSGTYAYRQHSVKLVTEHAPQDAELARIAQGLLAVQAKHRYQLTAVMEADGREVYSGAVCITVYKDGDELDDADATDGVIGYLRAFMDWTYKQLTAEYDYQTSDEYIRETLEASDYEFMEEGSRAS